MIVEDRISIAHSFVKPLELYINKPFFYYLKTDNVVAFVGRLNGVSDFQENVENSTVKEEVLPTLQNEIIKQTTPKTESKPEVENLPLVETTPKVVSTEKVQTTRKSEITTRKTIKPTL